MPALSGATTLRSVRQSLAKALRMLAPVAGHRLAVSAEFRLRGGTAGSVVDRLLDTVVVDEDE